MEFMENFKFQASGARKPEGIRQIWHYMSYELPVETRKWHSWRVRWWNIWFSVRAMGWTAQTQQLLDLATKKLVETGSKVVQPLSLKMLLTFAWNPSLPTPPLRSFLNSRVFHWDMQPRVQQKIGRKRQNGVKPDSRQIFDTRCNKFKA